MRIVVVALFVALNALLWSWGQGYFATLGWPPPGGHSAGPTPPTAKLGETTLTTSITDVAASLPTAAKASPDNTPPLGDSLAATPATASATNPSQPTPAPSVQASLSDANAVITTGLSERTSDQTRVATDAPMSNKASFTGDASATCWRARTWPVEGKEGLQLALQATAAQVLWRIVPYELAQRWVLLVAAGNTSLEQRKALLSKNGINYRDSEAPLPNGLIVATFVARDSAETMLSDLKRKGIPAEVMQERPATPVWELHIFADQRAAVDQLLERVKGLPRYADSPLRVGKCEL